MNELTYDVLEAKRRLEERRELQRLIRQVKEGKESEEVPNWRHEEWLENVTAAEGDH